GAKFAPHRVVRVVFAEARRTEDRHARAHPVQLPEAAEELSADPEDPQQLAPAVLRAREEHALAVAGRSLAPLRGFGVGWWGGETISVGVGFWHGWILALGTLTRPCSGSHSVAVGAPGGRGVKLPEFGGFPYVGRGPGDRTSLVRCL